MKIDHVLYAAADLDEVAARIERAHGLASYAGGDHPLFGTGNVIVPLGDAYIELIGVTDPAVAAQNPLGVMVGDLAARGGGWMTWVVAVEDIDAHAVRVGSFVIPGHRVRPDGATVSWRAAGMERMLEDRRYPFFIEWDDPAAHPGARAGAPSSIVVEVAAEEEGVRAWLGDLPANVSLTAGDAGLHTVTVDGRRIL